MSFKGKTHTHTHTQYCILKSALLKKTKGLTYSLCCKWMVVITKRQSISVFFCMFSTGLQKFGEHWAG